MATFWTLYGYKWTLLVILVLLVPQFYLPRHKMARPAKVDRIRLLMLKLTIAQSFEL